MSEIKLVGNIYKIVKIGRNVAETIQLLNGYDSMGYEIVCSYMNGDHLILKKKEKEDE